MADTTTKYLTWLRDGIRRSRMDISPEGRRVVALTHDAEAGSADALAGCARLATRLVQTHYDYRIQVGGSPRIPVEGETRGTLGEACWLAREYAWEITLMDHDGVERGWVHPGGTWELVPAAWLAAMTRAETPHPVHQVREEG